MSLETLLDRFPTYARDIKLNLSAVLKQAELTPQQTWGTAVATAIASRNNALTQAITQAAAPQLSAQALEAARSAAAVMGMNNVYYRFLHMPQSDKYTSIPARLRMQVIRSHGVDPVDFELWCTAVSAVNNCHVCVSSHEKVLRDKGMEEEKIVAAIRIAAVIHAAAAVLDEQDAVEGLTQEETLGAHT
ncbi:MAG TPA: carboxymuconolactone decarboxylase family protein [Bryobacteraceae bacterium]|nr:carboxymuconolactone decarboxylase family protein [Bryobacteraceae bacterium]